MEETKIETAEKQLSDFWQAEVLGQVYDTDFAEMAQWISDGALMPTDKVRRGNLRWLDAGRVPTLLPFFNAKRNGIEPPQIQTSYTDGENQTLENSSETQNFPPPSERQFPTVSENQHSEIFSKDNHEPIQEPELEQNIGDFCILHNEAEAVFHCETCANVFCRECPKSYGGNVKICPMCGAMLKKLGERDEKKEKEIEYWKTVNEGFGFKEIGKSFAHPFKFKASLIFGGVMFMCFTLGQSAGALGGIVMMFAALFCFMLSNMLGFGILANTVEKFSQGKTETNFMPDFDDFNLWDDVVHPFFLSIGVYLSSFGIFVLVLIYVTYSMFTMMQTQSQKLQSTEKAAVTSPYLVDENKAMDQSDQVKKLIEGVKKQAEERKSLAENGLNDKVVEPEVVNNEEQNFNDTTTLIRQNQKQEMESVVGKTEETKNQEFNNMFSGLETQGLPLLALTVLAFLWGIFYFPAACAVAGYTRSFTATINPSVGLDTIR
ncbi:MAG: hypothetical protein ABIP06_09280, partial [Pyrinomonadaceae bacterium]